jgi:hypothetical protein
VSGKQSWSGLWFIIFGFWFFLAPAQLYADMA